jgi:transposase
MFAVEVYAAVRRFVFTEGHSRREAARVFGLSRETVAKMCRFSLPPGYTRAAPAGKPKLGPLLGVLEAILAADRTAPVKQRHTAKRIFERLRDEHGYGGGYTVVKDHVRLSRARGRETFVPLAHPPGHAQVDFGEATGVVGGVRQKIHFFCLDLPQSDACFVKAYPRETTEAFLDGHVSAFGFFGGVPLSIPTTTPRLRWPRSAAMASASARAPSPSWSATTCIGIASAGPARVTTRARSRGW